MSDRSFTISHSEVGISGGRYVGKTPYAVAAKAARAIFKEYDSKKKPEIRFELKETTRDSKGKVFKYIGVKESLETPIVVKRGDSQITINHKYHVKSCRA